MDEALLDHVTDDWRTRDLPAAMQAALALADAFLGTGAPPTPDDVDRLRAHFTPDARVELGVALVCFRAYGTVAVALGGVPASMPITVVEAPSL